jgi:hypothetical protein
MGDEGMRHGLGKRLPPGAVSFPIPHFPIPSSPHFNTPVTSFSVALAAAGSTTIVPVIAPPWTLQSYV